MNEEREKQFRQVIIAAVEKLSGAKVPEGASLGEALARIGFRPAKEDETKGASPCSN